MKQKQALSPLAIKVYLMTLLLFLGCGRLQFQSKEGSKVSFYPQSKYSKEVRIKGNRSYYLWGLLPFKHSIFVEDELRKYGHTGLASTRISETLTATDVIWTMFTLGMYAPKSFIIEGFTEE